MRCIKEVIPESIARLFSNKHEMHADREWNSLVYVLTFNLKPGIPHGF